MPDTGADIFTVVADALLTAAQIAAAEALDASQASVVCGVSRSKWLALVSAGQAPSAVELGVGRCPRWLKSELMAWLKCGAPTMRTWASMRVSEMRKAS